MTGLPFLGTLAASAASAPADVARTIGNVARAPLDLVRSVVHLSSSDGPLNDLGRRVDNLNAEDGYLAHMRHFEVMGPSLQRLADPDGPLSQLEELAASLAQLHSLAELGERLGTVEGHIASLDTNIARLQPSLDALALSLAELQGTITTLAISLEPVGRLAQRVPGGAKRRRAVAEGTAIEEPDGALPPAAEDAA